MARLALSSLGPFQATLDGEPVTAFESNKVRALLAYLAVEVDRPHRREKLAGLLWPEWPDRAARSNLRYALSNLRQAIGDQQATPPFLHISRHTIQFNSASDAWVDVTAFAELLGARTQTTSELEETVGLYHGEFLEGFYVSDSVSFEEWMLFKREQIGRQVLSALHCLAAAYERRGEYERALFHAWRQVELEPWREKARRQLMRLLALNGQRGAALAQYETCRRALAEELGVEPAQETTGLYEQIRDGALDLGQVEEQALAKETEEAAITLPRQPVEPAPKSPAPARRRSSGWRMVGTRLALVGSGLLLLLTMATITFLASRSDYSGTVSSAMFAPSPQRIAAQPEARIVHVCEGVMPPQICVYEPRTGHLIQVTDNLEFGAIGPLSWSPDGQQIVFNAGSDFEVTQRHDRRLYIINADGSDLRHIFSESIHGAATAWSPDGQWIAFDHKCELWIIHPDGSGAQKLFGEFDKLCTRHFGWSPDGQWIALLSTEYVPFPLPEKAWVINRDGTASRVVHSFEQRLDLGLIGWSPDGQHIACVREYDGEREVLLINADGSGEPQVISDLPSWWLPDFWPQWGKE
jgi:DNA-binding SARP family transcriptional activator